MTKIVHNIHDGFCVTCEETAEWLREHGQELAMHGTGGIVWWTIRIPGEGDVDETFAPTYAEALEYAREHVDKRANVRFDRVDDAISAREAHYCDSSDHDGARVPATVRRGERWLCAWHADGVSPARLGR